MIEDGEHSRYTLDTLIEQCGFNSRATFFRNFKKVSGITPNDISEEIKNSQNSELKYICSLKLLYTVIYYRCNILLYRALLYI